MSSVPLKRIHGAGEIFWKEWPKKGKCLTTPRGEHGTWLSNMREQGECKKRCLDTTGCVGFSWVTAADYGVNVCLLREALLSVHARGSNMTYKYSLYNCDVTQRAAHQSVTEKPSLQPVQYAPCAHEITSVVCRSLPSKLCSPVYSTLQHSRL